MRTPAFFFWLHLWIWLKTIFKMAKHMWVFIHKLLLQIHTPKKCIFCILVFHMLKF
jgi:hypothetical protein